jgi:hypothetical protein
MKHFDSSKQQEEIPIFPTYFQVHSKSKLQQKVEQISAQLRIWILTVTDLPLLGKESGCNLSGAGIAIAITGKCKQKKQEVLSTVHLDSLSLLLSGSAGQGRDIWMH